MQAPSMMTATTSTLTPAVPSHTTKHENAAVDPFQAPQPVAQKRPIDQVLEGDLSPSKKLSRTLSNDCVSRIESKDSASTSFTVPTGSVYSVSSDNSSYSAVPSEKVHNTTQDTVEQYKKSLVKAANNNNTDLAQTKGIHIPNTATATNFTAPATFVNAPNHQQMTMIHQQQQQLRPPGKFDPQPQPYQMFPNSIAYPMTSGAALSQQDPVNEQPKASNDVVAQRIAQSQQIGQPQSQPQQMGQPQPQPQQMVQPQPQPQQMGQPQPQPQQMVQPQSQPQQMGQPQPQPQQMGQPQPQPQQMGQPPPQQVGQTKQLVQTAQMPQPQQQHLLLAKPEQQQAQLHGHVFPPQPRYGTQPPSSFHMPQMQTPWQPQQQVHVHAMNSAPMYQMFNSQQGGVPGVVYAPPGYAIQVHDQGAQVPRNPHQPTDTNGAAPVFQSPMMIMPDYRASHQQAHLHPHTASSMQGGYPQMVGHPGMVFAGAPYVNAATMMPVQRTQPPTSEASAAVTQPQQHQPGMTHNVVSMQGVPRQPVYMMPSYPQSISKPVLYPTPAPNASATPEAKSTTRQKSADPKSRFRGVRWYKRTNKWVVQVRINGHRKHIGYFSKEEEAAEAYCSAIKQAALAKEGKKEEGGDEPAAKDTDTETTATTTTMAEGSGSKAATPTTDDQASSTGGNTRSDTPNDESSTTDPPDE